MFGLRGMSSFLWANFNIIICLLIDLLDKYRVENSVFSIKLQFQDLNIFTLKILTLTSKLISIKKIKLIREIISTLHFFFDNLSLKRIKYYYIQH